MDLKKILKIISEKIIILLFFQSVAMVVSLPFIVFNGLSFSKLCFFGNIVFYPVLCVFIFLCSLVFISEAFEINNYFIINLLDKFCFYWKKALEKGSKDYIFFISKKEFFIFLIISILIFFALKKLRKNNVKNFFITLFLALNLISLNFVKKLLSKVDNIKTLSLKKRKGTLLIKRKNNFLELKDKGFFNQFMNPKSMLLFEVEPEMAKSFGTNKVKVVKVEKLNFRTILALLEIAEKLNPEKIQVSKKLENKTKNTKLEEKKLLEKIKALKIELLFKKNF